MEKDKLQKYEEVKRRQRNIIIASIILTVFAVGNFYIYKEISRAEEFFNPYVFLVIININVVFFLTILAISLRHLIKLFFESKETQGKLRVKLSIILISMIFFPAIIISTVSISLISDATNFWFSGKVEQALKSAKTIVDITLNQHKRYIKYAGELLKQEKVNPYNVKKIFNLKSITFTDENKIPEKIYGKPLSFKNMDFSKEFTVINDKFLRYITYDKAENKYIILDARLPEIFVEKKKQIEEITKAYSKFRHYKKPVRVSYIVTMLTITMFVIGAAIWFGQYIVRNLTYPLEELVKASKEVAKGNLNVSIRLKSSDEIGILINEFNQMVRELKNLYIKLEKSNRELKINQEYLEAVLENARTGVIYSDKTGKIKKINKAAENILGIKRSQLENKDISYLLNILGISSNQLDTEKTVEIKGKVIIVKATKISEKGLVLVFDDITDVVIAEKARTWREIAQRIAHEIKNPLTPIKLAAERIERQYRRQNENFPQILEKSVKAIYSEVEHLSKLVKDFRQFAMNDKLDITEFNLKNLFEELKRSYQTDKFKIHIDVPKNLIIKADCKLLRQAFSNIIQNSLEILKDGGEVYIKVKDIENYIKIIFKDTGKGISKEEVEKIFVPYYSNKPKGSGLGLTITKEIIEKHKGKIKAISSNDGAIFEIILPKEAR